MGRVSTVFLSIVALVLTGCYNNPDVSRRHPGSGPQRFTGGPSVGPGTVSGGSTAGPQPAKAETGGHVMPTAAGAHEAAPGLGHAEAAHPVVDPKMDTVKGPASRQGNTKGGDDRGPAEHSEERIGDQTKKGRGAHD
jgi:hypothetical protein